MTDAVQAVQAAAIAALQAHPVLTQYVTGIYDGPPPRAQFPYISVIGGPSSDWSTKTELGREIRFALTIWDDGEAAGRLHSLIGHTEDAMAAMARDLGAWHVVSHIFFRSLIVRDGAGPWSGLVEYRTRLITNI